MKEKHNSELCQCTFCPTSLHLLHFGAFAETMSVSRQQAGKGGEGGWGGLPPRLALQTLGSSSNQSAIRRRLLWATDDSSSDYPGVTAGIFSISAPPRLKAFSALELHGSYGSRSRVKDVGLGRSVVALVIEQEISAQPQSHAELLSQPP